jgi:hypothetical protein
MYKAGDYQFVIQEHPQLAFHEVSAWLKANYFQKQVPTFEQKQISSLHQMITQI